LGDRPRREKTAKFSICKTPLNHLKWIRLIKCPDIISPLKVSRSILDSQKK
jgi:hypothetical protein